MLSFAKILTAAIVVRSLLLGTTSVNGFNTGQDRVLSRKDVEFPSTLGELEYKPYKHEDDTASLRKLLQTGGTNGPWTPTQKITAGDGEAEDYFGWPIALYGTTLVVGAPSVDDRGTDSGSVYVFEKSNVPGMSWTLSAKLTAWDGEADDEFGRSIALDGTTLVVGAPFDDDRGTNSGSVYVFEKSSVPGIPWARSTKLTAGDGEAYDSFGRSIALDGTTLVVGAPYDDDRGTNSGSVYVFEKSNVPGMSWSQSAKLTAWDGEAGDTFGWSIALDGAALVVGADWDDDRGSNSGSVYVFEKSNVPGIPWARSTKLTAGDGEADDSFGSFIALYGTTLIVGAPFDDDRGSNSGSVYVFEKSNVPGIPWTQSTKLTAGDGEADEYFGWPVALHGNTLAVGVYDNDRGPGSGSVYVFEKSNVPGIPWTQSTKLTAGDGAADDEFGLGIALYGNMLVVGAPYDDDRGSDSGSVYVFESEALLPPPSPPPPPTSSVNGVRVPSLPHTLGSLLLCILLSASLHEVYVWDSGLRSPSPVEDRAPILAGFGTRVV